MGKNKKLSNPTKMIDFTGKLGSIGVDEGFNTEYEGSPVSKFVAGCCIEEERSVSSKPEERSSPTQIGL
ncbi:hypothetical protein CCACVL1_24749 [Corchorus capsularis]|uniref:Uncharacterized protein n=1 Tax=Corchorus capsularis TaxID=210143 RepID=A0A1R3GN89_COCAP|nr:hypothetical protein CCACVL1_24749 [Corchorus capsularis]